MSFVKSPVCLRQGVTVRAHQPQVVFEVVFGIPIDMVDLQWDLARERILLVPSAFNAGRIELLEQVAPNEQRQDLIVSGNRPANEAALPRGDETLEPGFVRAFRGTEFRPPVLAYVPARTSWHFRRGSRGSTRETVGTVPVFRLGGNDFRNNLILRERNVLEPPSDRRSQNAAA